MSQNKKGQGMGLSVLNDYVSSLSATYTTVGQLCQTVCLPEGVLFAVALSDKLASVVRMHVGWDSVHQSASHIGWTDHCHSCSDLFAKHNEPLRLLG